MGHKIRDLEKLQKKLDELPEINESEREVTKQEAIRRIAPTIAALQSRGYSMERIAEIITSEGFEIKVQSLKSYLTRARKQTKGKSQRGTKSGSSRSANDIDATLTVKPMNDQTNASGRVKKTAAPNAKSSAFLPQNDSADI